MVSNINITAWWFNNHYWFS